jgi:hypothetical protein
MAIGAGGCKEECSFPEAPDAPFALHRSDNVDAGAGCITSQLRGMCPQLTSARPSQDFQQQ